MSKKNINILFITHYPGMYGANQSLCTLMLELKNNFHVEPVVLLKEEGPICDFLKKNSINYHIIHFYWWVNSELGIFQKLLNLRKQLRNYFIVKKVSNIFKYETIDLLYSNSFTVNLGASLHKNLKIPHIWHIRENLASYNFKFSLGERISHKIIRNGADRFIVNSDYLLLTYKNLLPDGLVIRIYNGLPLDRFSCIKNNIKRDSASINLCLTGIVCDQKNQMDAIRAIQILVNEKEYTNIRLHLIGKAKDDYFEKLSEYIYLKRLKEYIIYHGHQDDVNELLSWMHIGLMCSRDEAFGRVTIEYMLNCMPVIASNSGANEEIVKDGINGYIYNIYDAEELSEKIRRFLDHPELIRRMGQIAHEYAKENFSSEQNTSSVYNVIKELIEKPK